MSQGARAQGIPAVRGFGEVTFGPASRLTIRVKQPETEHMVSVGKLQAWLYGGAKSPNEQVRRNRLKQLLSR